MPGDIFESHRNHEANRAVQSIEAVAGRLARGACFESVSSNLDVIQNAIDEARRSLRVSVLELPTDNISFVEITTTNHTEPTS